MSAIKILVAENELLISEAIASTLADAGYQVTGQVSHGEDAVIAAAGTPPDLIIMDIKLDGKMDGIAAAWLIRKQKEIPLIYLTDMDDKQTISRARQTNPSAYLLKPFNDRQLLTSINLALYNRSHNREAEPADAMVPADVHYVIRDVFFIKNKKGNMEKVKLEDINYIEASGAYTYVYTDTDKHTLIMSLNHVLDSITLPSFVRVHKSYGINIEKVTEIKGNLFRK
ncbi:MAG: response regulator [Bacteroidota bacterium]